MVQQKNGPETSYGERKHKRLQLVYARQTRERQYFMQELQEIRKQKLKQVMRTLTYMNGPTWYQVLSVPQRQALDYLAIAIYQDLIERLPSRTAVVLRKVGIFPRPDNEDLMSCIFRGRNDPKQMLAELFLLTYGHPIEGKRSSYCLNARVIMTSILYLGFSQLVEELRERFKPDTEPAPPPPKPKKKPEPPLKSPYLQNLVAALYLPPRHKKFVPPPLPNLDDLNEPFEEDPPLPKTPPPPPPPPPPKKRIPLSLCNKAADIVPFGLHNEVAAVAMATTTRTSQRKHRGSKMCLTEVKKTYGICITRPKKGSRRRRLKAPMTGVSNAKYLIQGVVTVSGFTVYILGSVSILPSDGDLMHGGFRYLEGEYLNIHLGIRGYPPPPKPDPCDCIKQWQDPVLSYVKKTKCYCEHNYDYGHEGTFPPDELPYFQKATGHSQYQFNYHTIFDLDEKSLMVEKEFKKLWDTDSVIGPKNPLNKDKKKKLKKKSSKTCLGQDPKPEDYLKCALRFMRRNNLAAKLPDVHLVPELQEWMRRRIHGPYSQEQRRKFIKRSNAFFQIFSTLAVHGWGHIGVKREPEFLKISDWMQKLRLNRKFTKFTYNYKLELFKSFARINNLFWSSMYLAKFPDKKFREIFFSYLFGTVQDLCLMNPYSSLLMTMRTEQLAKKRYICLPAGIEPSE